MSHRSSVTEAYSLADTILRGLCTRCQQISCGR